MLCDPLEKLSLLSVHTRAMQIIEVKDKSTTEAFRQLPFRIYADDPNWIPHLRQDTEDIFDRKKNKFFRYGDAFRWILQDDRGKTIGRIAAFVNDKLPHTRKREAGGVGFFECVDDLEAAKLLFDTAKQWLRERGRKLMDGPINFGEKDRYWGLLTDGFDRPPHYAQNYHPPYYRALFEAYGFQVYYMQFIFYRDITTPLQPKFQERYERLKQDARYRCEHVSLGEMDRYAEDFRTVYNRAWSKHRDFSDMSSAQAKALLRSIKPAIDERLIWFVYFDDQPIGFYISLPELNAIFRRIGDNLNAWRKLKFWIYKQLGVCEDSFGIAFGVDPDHQGKGVEGFMFQHMAEVIQKKKLYRGVVITWIGDFNPKMIAIIRSLGCEQIQELTTYRHLFDPNDHFERYPLLDA